MDDRAPESSPETETAEAQLDRGDGGPLPQRLDEGESRATDGDSPEATGALSDDAESPTATELPTNAGESPTDAGESPRGTHELSAADGEPRLAPHEDGLGFPVSAQEGKVLWIAVTAVAFFVALGVSYLDEDAFISFRVVDNFVRGEGLRWNVTERVQVFTNPLWVLALSVVEAMVRDISRTSYLLSAAASAAAVAVVAKPLQRRPVLVAAFLLPLLLSQAFTDYTSSGLENPFIYLFSALFIELLFRPDAFFPEERASTFSHLALYSALCATTRADTALLFTPVLLWLLMKYRKGLPFGRLLLGAAPLLVWLSFAYLYYGTIFPNPKYAKLNGGVDRMVYWRFGWTYLLDMARNDVVTFAGLVAAPVVGLSGLLGAGPSRRWIGPAAAYLTLGATVYSLYVIWIGGDFMAGRHWATPFFFVTCALTLRVARATGALATDEGETDPERLSEEAVLGTAVGKNLLYAAAVLLCLRFVVQPMTEERDVIAPREQGRLAIVREGEIRYQRYNCGFFESLFSKRGGPQQHSWSQDGQKQARRAASRLEREPDRRFVVIDSAAGKGPYYAGPLVDYVDPLGITDPLLARLPDVDGEMQLVGHLKRNVPKGYVRARETGDTSHMEPNLRKYYDALRLVISGPIFDGQRLRTMVRMTGGAYDDLLRRYVEADKAEREAARRRPSVGFH